MRALLSAQPPAWIGMVLLAMVVIALGGCAGGLHVDNPKPPTHVDMPVATLCVAKDELASHPEPGRTSITGDAVHDSEALAATDLRLRVWGRELLALLQGCVEQ